MQKYHHQSGKAASGKLVWNQHKYARLCNRPDISDFAIFVFERT